MKRFAFCTVALFVLALAIDAAVSTGRRGSDALASAITEIMFSFSNNSIANRTTSMHGLAQILDGNSTHVEYGDGSWGPIQNNKITGFLQTIKGGTGISTGNQWDAFRALAQGDPTFDAPQDQDMLLYSTHVSPPRWIALHKGDDGDFLSSSGGTVGWTSIPDTSHAGEGLGNVVTTPQADTVYRLAAYTGNKDGTEIYPTQIYTDSSDNLFVANNFQVIGTVRVYGQTLRGLNSGLYQPLVTPLVNCDRTGVVDYSATWSYVGDVVSVDGRVQIRVGASGGGSQFRIALPVPSDLAGIEDLSGLFTTVGPANAMTAPIVSEVTANNALFSFSYPTATATVVTFTYHFAYQVK